jgi:hypothetical protein
MFNDFRAFLQHLIKSDFGPAKAETVQTDHIQEVIFKAQQIVFLGMAYHDQNLQLLANPGTFEIKSVIGTAYGRSLGDIEDITNQIAAWAKPDFQSTFRKHIQIYNNIPATEIFDDYSRSL